MIDNVSNRHLARSCTRPLFNFQAGQGTSTNKEYMQILKEICDKDPINAHYITRYISLLVQVNQGPEYATGQAAANGNPESDKTEAIAAAQKVYESSLRYNAS